MLTKYDRKINNWNTICYESELQKEEHLKRLQNFN